MNKQLEKLLDVLNVQIPFQLLLRAEVGYLFRDGDINNWDPQNITYRFTKGPLECPFYPGYFYIPGFSRYVINTGGDLILVKTAQTRKWWKAVPPKPTTRGGYFILRLMADDGEYRSMYRHRALALVFKPYVLHPSHLVVNHLNGVGGDDRLENLEFCSQAENIQHAYDFGLFSGKTISIDAWNWKTDEKRSFDTLQACADALGFCYPTLYGRLKRGNDRRYSDGWRFKRQSEMWLPLKVRAGQNDGVQPVIIRNVFTEEKLIFPSVGDAAKHTNQLSGSVRRQCELAPSIPLNGWNFRYLNSFEGWPQYTDKHRQIFRDRPLRAGAGVEVYDLEQNAELFFTSMDEAAQHFNLSPITIRKLASMEGTRDNRFKFKLFEIDA